MKSFLLNIKNLFPYLLLIATYFFFVNIEARNSQKKVLYKKNIFESKKQSIQNKKEIPNYSHRIMIPVIPYGQ